DGTCDEVMPPVDLGAKFRAFGFDVYEINGNDMTEMVKALDLAVAAKNGKPKCIFGHTIKGKGVSYMENVCSWHGTAPNEAQYKQAIAELDTQYVSC
ncbi:MAG: transketolase, partial [Clostridiales bacterium]|nr:transketolase [Clostridiales bacterium]